MDKILAGVFITIAILAVVMYLIWRDYQKRVLEIEVPQASLEKVDFLEFGIELDRGVDGMLTAIYQHTGLDSNHWMTNKHWQLAIAARIMNAAGDPPNGTIPPAIVPFMIEINTNHSLLHRQMLLIDEKIKPIMQEQYLPTT